MLLASHKEDMHNSWTQKRFNSPPWLNKQEFRKYYSCFSCKVNAWPWTGHSHISLNLFIKQKSWKDNFFLKFKNIRDTCISTANINAEGTIFPKKELRVNRYQPVALTDISLIWGTPCLRNHPKQQLYRIHSDRFQAGISFLRLHILKTKNHPY